MADVKPIPDGYPQVTPYLIVDGAEAAIGFYTKVLGARERMHMPSPGGRIGHAELELGDSLIMLADEHPENEIRGPRSVGGTAVMISVYVEDVDARVRARADRGRDLDPRRRGPVLRRPLGPVRGPIWSSLEHRHARRGRTAGGDGEARRRSDGRLSPLAVAAKGRGLHVQAPSPRGAVSGAPHPSVSSCADRWPSLLSIQSCDLSGERPHLTNRTLAFLAFFDFLAFFLWLSRPEVWFDCSFSRLLDDSASPPFA